MSDIEMTTAQFTRIANMYLDMVEYAYGHGDEELAEKWSAEYNWFFETAVTTE